MYLHGFYEVSNYKVQRKFVYFIVAIYHNTLKSFRVTFYKKKQSDILHSYFY